VINREVIATALHDTVTGISSRFTAQERERAAKARKLYEILGFPSTKDLVRALKTGSIADTDVTAQDIVRAGIIYGRHPALLAGKTVERPTPYLREEPEPIERQTQVLYVDVAFEDGIPGMIGVAKPIDALMYADLPVHFDFACTSTAIDQLCGLLEQRGLSVVKVVVVGDTRFDPSKILALTERVAAGSHVSVAERAIRVVKERTRAIRSN
jgi:hypothetical protein